MLSVASPPLLRVAGVSKSFGGVRALRGVDLAAVAGEIHALMGENGSGKSTLANIVAGRLAPDQGRVELEGRPATIRSPRDAHRLGIALVSQELQLAPDLSVAENIFLGLWPAGPTGIAWETLAERAGEILNRLGLRVHPGTPVRTLSQDHRQMVEFARALAHEPRVLLLDEPTSALTTDQVEVLFQVLRVMRDRGACIVFVSHRMREVFALADRASVLRDGQDAGTVRIADTSEDEIVRLMVGRTLHGFYHKETVPIGEPVLEVSHLSRGILKDVSLSVRAGEIVGIAGLAGSGRTALARTIFGVRPAGTGEVRVDGRPINPRSPAEAMRAKIALIPEDRKQQGLVLSATVRENMMMAALLGRSSLAWLSARRERALAEGYVQTLAIRTPSVDVPVGELSGGNQQKVVLAKWLVSDPRVIVLDEPTQGIDIGAKMEIYRLVGRLVAEGRAVLLISSELPELLALSDRVLTMYRGRITEELPRELATEERVAHCIVSGLPRGET